MAATDASDIVEVLRSDDATAEAYLRLLVHAADIVEALREVEPPEWPRLLRLIPDEEERAEVVASFDEGERDELFDHIQPEEIASFIREMESDDAADIIGELEPDEERDVLASLPAEDRAEIEELLAWPQDSAGGIMQLERADVPGDATIDQAIARVRELVEDGVEIHRVYIVDEEQRLLGSVNMVDLLLHPTHRKMSEIAEPPLVTARPLLDQEEVADLFRRYDLVVLPVIDDDGHLLGRIMFDDIVDVLTEEAEEDALRMAGTDTEELLYRDRAIPIARVRLPWIGVNLLGSLVSAFLIHLYEPVIEQAILIASFVPVITAMGGNVGTQSATILTRGFATGRIDFDDLPRTVFKEFRVGLLMGVLCGTGVGVIAVVFFGGGRIYLGIVVFLAMVSAMTVAAVVGSTAPAVMKRFGVDPAIASGPFVTTANDIIGIVIYMSTALLFIEKLR